MPAGFLPSSDCLQRFARSLASENEPGFAVGVYAGGDLVSHGAAGCAVPEHGVLVTEHTVFDIASVSKHMTAACLLLLARDGLIDLDADIRPALPELAVTATVTLRQCLSHTSGLRDYFALCEIAGIGVPGMTEERFTDLITGQRDLDFPPGSAFSYCNTGYALASLLVRRATGSGLAQVAAQRVFSPLGMTATHFRADVSRLVPRLAAGYVAAPGDEGPGFRRYDTTEEVIGDGAVVTSLADLAAWHGFLADGAVLGPDIRDGLTDARPLTDGSATGYGLGLQAIAVDHQPAWWHSGSWAGYRAALISLPQHHAAVTVLANRNDRYASLVALAVAGAILTGDDPADLYRSLPGQAAGDTRAASAGAAALSGTWHEPDLDIFIDVAADGDQLVVGAGGEASAKERFFLAADGRWLGVGPAAAGCYAIEGGDLVALSRLSGRTEGRYRRAEAGSGQAVPAGLYWNDELRAAARVEAVNAGARIAIGLAPARRLVPAGDGVWRCQGGEHPGATPLTVRASGDGAELLVSAVGARRVRFGKVTGSGQEPELPRGLRDWAR